MYAFQSLREDSEFMDVTLSCDGEQIKAHKVFEILFISYAFIIQLYLYRM